MVLTKTPSIKIRRRRSTASEDGEAARKQDDIPEVKYFLDNRLPVLYFKQDILKLIHDLRIPKWKRVEMDMAGDMVVSRISGALTNAIYSVEAPSYIKEIIKATFSSANAEGGMLQQHGISNYKHFLPQKLLLRVYGPQVGHLIDRDHELEVLERLALREMGPRLLGTFTNGRFEQFLDADPLTKEDLWNHEVSAQIAKRMRELHDGLGLLEKERKKGPAIWSCYDHWITRGVEVLKILEEREPGAIERILHSDLDSFLEAVKKYRSWIVAQHGGEEQLKKELVFAHNDTQYGNILRYHPPKGSPLLAPKNEHRQLVVIDFEYSAQNPRAVDICNHFCEWMSDYHHEELSYHIWEDRYPDRNSQINFIQAYVEHGSKDFNEEEMEKEVNQLLQEVKNWRPGLHVYWAIWGVVQALQETVDDNDVREEKVEEQGGYRFVKDEGNDTNSLPEEEEDEEEFFDYVNYASEKIILFWNDMAQFGFIDKFNAPEKIIRD